MESSLRHMITRLQMRSLAPWCVGIITAFVAVVLAILGISPLLLWALALVVADISLWSAAITYVFSVERRDTGNQAIIRQQKSRMVGLAIDNFLLLVLLGGIWSYFAWFNPPTFVNVIPNKNVTMSPEAGTPPRTGGDALVLSEGEEQSASCYVVVRGETWLKFRNGWAPLPAFHYPAGVTERLPAPCAV
jgi:hypothetical protein